MSIFLLCEQAVGLVRGKRLILSNSERNSLESLDYEALTAAHAQDEAVVCALHFASVRDSLLEIYPWAFAKKIYTPPQLSRNESGWRYAFSVPNDCIKIYSVIAKDNRANFYEQQDTDLSEPEALVELKSFEYVPGYIYANRSPIYIRYQAKISDMSKWCAPFQDLFVIKLAEAIAPAIRADAQVIQGLENSAAQIIQAAIQNGLISNDETGLNIQRETRPISDYKNLYENWGDYSGLRT